MTRLFFLLFLLFLPLKIFAATLGDEFKKAETSDFIVFEHQKLVTLLRIKEKDKDNFAIEEITAPKSAIDLKTISWKSWIEERAPNHTSWIITSFDPETFKVKSTVSQDSHETQDIDALFQFLPTLLKLELHPVPESERKRIGPTPMPDEIDTRKIWQPTVIFDGKPQKTDFRVYKVLWPKDGSELSNKSILLYIPYSKSDECHCLDYFPVWVEVLGKFHNVKLRVIDSGKNLTFSHKNSQL